jgi:Secretion system C-terminal sorting domain
MKQIITILIFCSLSFSTKLIAQNSFGTDVIIDNRPIYQQENARVASAYNGWLYSAFTYTNTANDSNGYAIKQSKDNGFSWQTIGSNYYLSSDIVIEDIEIKVAGFDTNNLKLFVTRIFHSVAILNYSLIINTYNGNTGALLNVKNISTGTNSINDIDIATDYLSPSIVSSPYSIGIIYSVTGVSKDSIVYIGSIDGGVNFNIVRNLMSTTSYTRKVSICYGKSLTANNGRFFAAWEIITSTTDEFGHVYFSRNTGHPGSTWELPIKMDSVIGGFQIANRLRNPKVAAIQSTTINSNSGGITAIIACERNLPGSAAGTYRDIICYYNKDVTNINSSSVWALEYMAVSSNTGNMQCDITYNDSANVFLSSYYDSTLTRLVYAKHEINFVGTAQPVSYWYPIAYQYNDVNPGFFPRSRIAYNPKEKKIAAVWTSKTGTNNSKILFDSEYNLIYATLISKPSALYNVNIYPNPAKDFINVTLDLKEASQVSMELIDITGKQIMKNEYGNRSGEQKFRFDFSDLKQGLYLMQLKTNKETVSYKIRVEK